MIQLSVNINKIATLRNARGGNVPDLIKMAQYIENAGANGITVHPRPDERHVRYQDVRDLKEVLRKELNVEGYPSEEFMTLVEEVKPAQITLVPDKPEALTSNAGWDTIENESMLRDIVSRLKNTARVSIFVDPNPQMIEGAKKCGADRVELYTESYSKLYTEDKNEAIAPYIVAAKAALDNELGLNAGHDLNYYNLNFFNKKIPNLLEVSIGHALICDALEFGLKQTILIYRRCLYRSKKYINKHCLLNAEEMEQDMEELEIDNEISDE
ncbi:MAG: pyridoxine 5'-phosphate synthase [Bacteroidales bacterium]|jgi:pyridoxine 5-phosphate synthase|nr:pyridoxine 5'-phosphate synthase [Bacteroidales bacterium]